MKIKTPRELDFRSPEFESYVRLCRAEGIQFSSLHEAWDGFMEHTHPLTKKKKAALFKLEEPERGTTLLTGSL